MTVTTILPGDRVVSIDNGGGTTENGGENSGENSGSNPQFTRVVQQTLPDGRVLSVAIDVLSPFCGDSIVQQDQGEECDDGNEGDTDACRNNCLLPRCGDGTLSDGEQCEDGNTISGDGCSDQCVPDVPGRVKAVVIDLPISPLAGTVTGGGKSVIGGKTVTGSPDDEQVRATAISHAPAGETGPAAIGVMAAGAAAGWAWVRRRRFGQKDSPAA